MFGALPAIRSAGGPTLLADFDYTVPITAFDFSSVHTTDEWLLQEPSGAYANNVGSETLSNTNGLQNRTAVGLFDGTNHSNRKAWECPPSLNNATLHTSGTVAGDVNNADICVRMVVRSSKQWNGGDYIAGKLGTYGWWMPTFTAGQIQVGLRGGTDLFIISPVGQDLSDGAWHLITWLLLDVAATLDLKTDLGTAAQVDISALTVSLTNTVAMVMNGINPGGAQAIPGLVMAYFGVCIGANSAAMYAEEVKLPGRDPGVAAGKTELTTINRNSLVSHSLGAGLLGHFSGGTTPATTQLPIVYHSALAGLGLLCHGAIVNLCEDSEDFTQWVNGATIDTAFFADGPDGFRSATKLVAAGANGLIRTNDITVLGSVDYTFPLWIKELTVGVNGRVRLYDVGGASYSATTAYVATGTWQRVLVTGQITGGVITRLVIDIDADTEEVLILGAQLELGDGAGAYIRTSGAAASLVQSHYSATGDLVREKTGEILVVFALSKLPESGDTHYIFDTVTPADRRALSVNSAGFLKFLVNNAAGGLVAEITLGIIVIDTKITAQCQWDDGAGLGGNSVRAKLNMLAPVFTGSAFTDGGGFAAEISLGSSAAVANTAASVVIERLRCYRIQNPI